MDRRPQTYPLDPMLVFEHLVQSQRPATTPWVPVLDYSLEERRRVEGPHPQLIHDVLLPRQLLDIGCGPGHLVTLLSQIGVDALGADKHVYPNSGFYLDITQPMNTSGKFSSHDVVICREVLEHLTLMEIRRAVTNLCGLSSRLVYVTTRFSSEHDLLRVETNDDLDPTHITIMSKDLLRLLFTLEGFKARRDLEAQMDWKHLGRCLVYERV
jgi:SAM-dependent methyltransferase